MEICLTVYELACVLLITSLIAIYLYRRYWSYSHGRKVKGGIMRKKMEDKTHSLFVDTLFLIIFIVLIGFFVYLTD